MFSFTFFQLCFYMLLVSVVFYFLGRKKSLSIIKSKIKPFGTMIFFTKSNRIEDICVDFNYDISKLDSKIFENSALYLDTKLVNLDSKEGLNYYISSKEDCDKYKNSI